MRRHVKHATDAVIAGKSIGLEPISQVRRETATLQYALRTEVGSAQSAARHAGRRRLSIEFGELLPPAADTGIADDAFAEVVAQALASAWGQAGLQLFSQGDVRITQTQVRELVDAVDARLRRAAATEVARAFNDERERHAGRLFNRPGAFKIWSAILDGRTCSTCFAADGETTEVSKPFKAGVPPAHPNCRCVVEHLIVAKPERLEDVAIDYDLFKHEVRDVIREKRELPARHALGFAAESLSGTQRSPKTLTKKFDAEAYARRP